MSKVRITLDPDRTTARPPWPALDGLLINAGLKAYSDCDGPGWATPVLCDVSVEDGVARVVMPPMSVVTVTIETR